MARELPDPREILEELVDKTASQIDRLAPVAFDAAFDELTRYHRFLLKLNATQGADGKPFSYAAVPGEAWSAPHNQWISQYRRLFERAASHIGTDPAFMQKLANTPLRLLPDRHDPQMSDEILQAIIDLGVILIHQLEAWVTRRTITETAPGAAASPRISLAGSDAKSYANLLLNIIGSWESLLQAAPSIYGWRDDAEGAPNARWNSLRASWPFLWQHLRNTAYMLAVSVWNEDEAGAAIFRDALIRWPQTLSYCLADQVHLPTQRLLFPEVLSLEFGAAQERVKLVVPDYMLPVSADELFNVAIHGAHDDVLLLTAGLLLQWSMEQKQVGFLGARTASILLSRQLDDEDDARGQPHQNKSFGSLVMDIVRFDIAEGYGADLDYLVRSLDNMTERRVVPGRVFTPSTLHDRDGLRTSLLVMLLARVSENEGPLVERIRDLARNDAALPQGDRSLREILRGLDRVLKILEGGRPEVQRGLKFLRPDADFSESTAWAKRAISFCVQAIEAERERRLKDKPVDVKAITNLRNAAERAMIVPPGGALFFRGFSIERMRPHADTEVVTFNLNELNKAQFVDPPMETGTVGFEKFYADLVLSRAGERVWRQFTQRARERVRLHSRIGEQVFWDRVKRLALDVGPEPILITPRRAQGRALRTVIREIEMSKMPLKISRKAGGSVGSFYAATIEGVDIYESDFQSGKAWLFSPYLLQSIQYSIMNDGDHILNVSFHLSEDGVKGSLVAEFGQKATWADWAVFEIDYDD